MATLVSGHNLSAITLTQSTTNAPGGTISASGAKILSGSTDVTGNYAITYKTGTLTILQKERQKTKFMLHVEVKLYY